MMHLCSDFLMRWVTSLQVLVTVSRLSMHDLKSMQCLVLPQSVLGEKKAALY